MTEALPLKFCLEACGATQLQGVPDAVFRGVSTDTRRLQAGQLFVALSGERFDGHAFLGQAAAAGAAALLVERGREVPGGVTCAVLVVDNTRAALGRLAARWREELRLPVVAVAGSNGKTTTKELLASVLGVRMEVLASEASYNNDVGVPLTLLRMERTHRAAVIEVGSNHPGELAPLLRMVRPEVGVLTSLGREHLEHFGSIEGVVAEEGWVAEVLAPEGQLFANGDAPHLDRVLARCRAPVVTVGWGGAAGWRAVSAKVQDDGTEFEVVSPCAGLGGAYRVGLLGRHQVYNAMLALAVGAHFGLTREELVSGLAACRPARRRMESWVGASGVRVLDDAYNANVDSMIAALCTLGELPCRGRRVAVMGDMAEVGAGGEAMHEEVGRYAAEAGVDQLLTVGRMAAVMGAAARRGGLGRVLEFGTALEAAAVVGRLVRPGDAVLVKASRSTGLEVVSEALRGQEAPVCA